MNDRTSYTSSCVPWSVVVCYRFGGIATFDISSYVHRKGQRGSTTLIQEELMASRTGGAEKPLRKRSGTLSARSSRASRGSRGSGVAEGSAGAPWVSFNTPGLPVLISPSEIAVLDLASTSLCSPGGGFGIPRRCRELLFREVPHSPGGGATTSSASHTLARLRSGTLANMSAATMAQRPRGHSAAPLGTLGRRRRKAEASCGTSGLVGPNQIASRITCAAWSPDGSFLAVGVSTGTVAIYAMQGVECVDLYQGFRTFFGSPLCLSWSHDGALLAVGGQDDLVTFYSLPLASVVLWGEGHQSWVESISFDQRYGDTTNTSGVNPAVYRILSVAQDCQLMVWDLTLDANIHASVLQRAREWQMSSSSSSSLLSPPPPPSAASAASAASLAPSSSRPAVRPIQSVQNNSVDYTSYLSDSGDQSVKVRETRSVGQMSNLRMTTRVAAANLREAYGIDRSLDPPLVPPLSSSSPSSSSLSSLSYSSDSIWPLDVPLLLPDTSRDKMTFLMPSVAVGKIHTQPCSAVLCCAKSLVTVDWVGVAKAWKRP